MTRQPPDHGVANEMSGGIILPHTHYGYTRSVIVYRFGWGYTKASRGGSRTQCRQQLNSTNIQGERKTIFNRVFEVTFEPGYYRMRCETVYFSESAAPLQK